VKLAHLAPLPRAAPRTRLYRSRGLQSDRSATRCLETTAQRFGAVTALVDLTDGNRAITYAALHDDVTRLVATWRRAGLKPGDPILMHAPNSRELVTATWAAFQGGFVAVPVVDLFRTHELRQVVRQLGPAAFVAVAEDRGFYSARVLDEIAGELGIAAAPRLILRGEQAGWMTFEEAVGGPSEDGEPADVGPDEPAAIAFTSGSTSEPKGVVHSSTTLFAEVHQQQWAKAIGWRDRGYVGVTIAHLAGLLNALLLPASVAATVVLSRSQSLARTAEEILEHEVTQASGPTTILDAIIERCDDPSRLALRRWWTGGMTVSPERIARAGALGIAPFRTYGMTEFPTVTQCSELDSPRQRLETDGRLPPGVECVAVDEQRQPLPAGAEGELRVRGPEQMLGYLDPGQHAEAVDADGWLYTGDLGLVDHEGCVLIRGRLKEIINRGGEKLSARDIEDVANRHPAIKRVAVVAVPDARYGETPQAFVSFAAGVPAPTPAELSAFLQAEGLAVQKVPTRWHQIDEWPETSMGKPKKQELLRMLSDPKQD
jgi:acyl-CoA synthetase (AMP-forming)/AMP-acid ligase II